jgi:hypothetical protein
LQVVGPNSVAKVRKSAPPEDSVHILEGTKNSSSARNQR